MQPLLFDLSLLMSLFCTNLHCTLLQCCSISSLLHTKLAYWKKNPRWKNSKCKVCFSGNFINLNADDVSRRRCRYRKQRQAGVAALTWTIKATPCNVGKLKVILNQNNWLTACSWESLLKYGLTHRWGIFGLVKMLKIEDIGKLVLKVWQSTMFQNNAAKFLCRSGSYFILILLRCC